jgi:guanylate kinase
VSGRLFVIAAPSGAGKTSLVRAAMERNPGLSFSVSYTTRALRPGEVDGQDYHFVTPQEFGRMAQEGAFLEHAEVFGSRYGTGRDATEAVLAQGRDLILDIDYQGAQQVRARRPDVIDIFILPPSRAALEQRLRGRRTDSPAAIARRLADSVNEILHWGEFRYVVVNEDFERALEDLSAIMAGRGDALAVSRPGLAELAASLCR